MKYLIIGAGLSGLTTAYKLYQAGEKDFQVLEARERIGGRIWTHAGIDLGATWFHSHHQQVDALLADLRVDKFHQYNTGRSVLVYSTMAPEHYFEHDPEVPSAFRIAGGSSALIEALAKPFREKIKTNCPVLAIQEGDKGLQISTREGDYVAEQVLCTLPPKLAVQLDYAPPLSSALKKAMEDTHTWMSNAIKLGMTFRSPFWRDKNLSGTILGQVGPVIELYDHTDHENQRFALMGFINEGMRDVPAENRKTRILAFLSKYLGQEIMNYLTYEEKDWSQDKNTATESLKSVYMSPNYGHPLFDDFHMQGKLLFSGAETSPVYGGYMDGAIYTGIRAALKLRELQT